MPRYRPEPVHRHGSAPKTAALLVNLGTPAAPTAAALRPYLAEFLSDPRVIELPRWLWWPILHGIILRTRPRASAEKYASIWLPEGSPLAVYTRRQAEGVASRLEQHALAGELVVDWAMRYGSPSVASRLDALREQGVDRIVLLPMYPQYSAATVASTWDAAADWMRTRRNPPEMRLVRHFHAHPAYVRALAARVRSHWQEHGRPDRLLMSFHGMPEATLAQGDPYFCECHATARLLAEELELAPAEWEIAFQSRFGRAAWLKPYAAGRFAALPGEGVQRLDVICPGFVADCVETLEEIALEGRQTFIGAGGREFHAIACLNDDPVWLDALAGLVDEQLAGWTPRHASPDSHQRACQIAAGAPAAAPALEVS
ncbi:ferrochelatase [Laribacter hongkongensis]|uniref:ferrochelatase n=1 Tax=Laribacter hongkongensis TaxID=168471 RepID=UPI001EFEA1BD|nr:ferrochelatase [Laribacter hongkongensis]MCG9123713.1 ferrochelatase [Laribacter hongkongensis]